MNETLPGTGETKSSNPPRYLAVVGRGNTARFRFLRDHLEEPGFVQVIWDRRVQERRHVREAGVLDRRCGDRRQALPVTWTALSFVLAPRTEPVPQGSDTN